MAPISGKFANRRALASLSSFCSDSKKPHWNGSVLFFISSFFIRSFFIRSFFIISFFIRSFFIHYYFYTFIFYTVHFLYGSFFIWFIFYNSKFIFSKNLILLHFIVKLYKKNYSSTVGTGWHLLGNGSHVFITHD